MVFILPNIRSGIVIELSDICFFLRHGGGQLPPHRRTLQTLAVDASNENDWVIPFTQMTVHMVEQD